MKVWLYATVESLSLLLIAFLTVGCQSNAVGELGPPPIIHNHAVGRWVNRFADDPALVGVRVQQFPDCEYEAEDYEGKHPCMIIYVFQDSYAFQDGFEADGSLSSSFSYNIKADDVLWETIDRSFAKTGARNTK